MKDDPKSNIQFVRLVEKYPVLYDVRYDGYSRKEAQDKAWSDVAAAMKDTVANCKEKWRNIRTCLTRHLRHKSTGKMKRPYYLAPYMAFLIPFTKTRIIPSEFLTGNSTNDNPDPLRDDSDHAAMSDEEAECLQQQNASDEKGGNSYAVCLPWEVGGDFPKEEEAITEEEEEDVIDVVEEDVIEVVEEEDEMEAAEDDIERKGEEGAMSLKISSVQGDDRKKRIKSEETRPIRKRKIIRVASGGGFNSFRTNHFDSKNARYVLDRSPSPSNPDLDFFRSILPEVSSLTPFQKSRFRMSVLKTLDQLLYAHRMDV